MPTFKECVSTIRQAAPNLSEQQAQELFDEVNDIYEGLKADGNVADLEAELTRAVEKRVGEEERAAINEKRMRALNYKTRMRFIQKLRQVPDKDVPRFLESILAGEYGNSPYKTSIERTFGVRGLDDAAKRKHLESSWNTLLTGRRDDSIKDLSDPPGYKGPGNLAKKLGHHRSLHFKDGQSAWKYMKDYGLPDVGTSFFGGVDMMSRNIATLQHLGPNPKFMLDEFIERAGNKLGGAGKGKINKEYINRLYDEVTGVGSILPEYDTKGWRIARGMNWAKNLSNSALLGGTVLTSIADLGTAAVRLNEVGVSFLNSHAAVVGGILRGRRSGEMREVADSIGLGIDSLISGVQSRWTGNDGINGQGSQLVSTVMRITGMNWLNDTMKTSVVLTMSNYIAKQAGKSFDDIHPSLRREMSGYGITAEDFASITTAVRDIDGKKYIDVDQIGDSETASRIQEFLGGFADSAILTPGARTNALIRGADKRGDPTTEIRMLFFNLKSYSVAFYQDILSRTWSSGGAGVGLGLHLILSMTVYGHIANTLKDWTAGKEKRELTVENFPKVFMDAFLTAGGLGFYGDLLIGAIGEQRFGQGFLEAVGGPVIGNALRSARAVGDLGEFVLGDEEGLDRAAYSGMRTAKQMIPGANIFYTRMALDYLFFWEMSEYLRPGWAQSFEDRVREETGQEFYLKPTESVYGGLLN